MAKYSGEYMTVVVLFFPVPCPQLQQILLWLLVETAPIPLHPSTADFLKSMNHLYVGNSITQMRYESTERDYASAERDFEQQRGMYPIYDYHYRQEMLEFLYDHFKWYTHPTTLDVPSMCDPMDSPYA